MKDFLTAEQIKELKQAHRQEKNKRFADRIKVILALNNGVSYIQASELFLLEDETIRRYEKNYIEQGLQGLLETGYKGSFCRLKSSKEEQLKLHLQEKIYLSTKEISFYIYKKYKQKFSLSGTRHLVKRLGFIYKKPCLVPGKADIIKQQEFILFYKKYLSKEKLNEEVYFVDAVHPVHNSKASYGWILKGEKKTLKTNTGRQRLNINGALSLKKKELIIEESSMINAQSSIGLFKKILAKNPQAKKITLITDNARYYRSRLLQEWLKGKKIKLIYLPPYSPNLNLIERVWKYFYKKIIYNKYYEKYEVFRSKILNFFKTIKNNWPELETLLTENFQLCSAK